MKNKKLLAVIVGGIITSLIFWACDAYYYKEDMVRVTLDKEYHDSKFTASIDTCMTDILPYQNDFIGVGSILIGFINNKPFFTASLWSFSDSTDYFLDVSNDTIYLSNGDVYFHSQGLYGGSPVSVTINDTTYLSPDTIHLGSDVVIWNICVNPLHN